MKKILVVLGHSNYKNSLSNKTIVEKIKDSENITVRNLDDISENCQFDVEAEQTALSGADVIVFQFPLHWYSVPAILKKWMDDVFTFGFAYGPGGDKLTGKKVIFSLTTGGPTEAYSPDGDKGYTVEQFIAPLLQTCSFTGMEASEVIYTNGQLYIPGMMGDKEEVEQKAKAHAEKLLEAINKL